MECYWDANGNLSQIIGCKSNKARLHDWDEENRLRFVLGEKYAGYYGYDAKGERVYKLTGTSGIEQVNAGYSYWKMAKSPEKLNHKQTRMGTYDNKLNKIGE